MTRLIYSHLQPLPHEAGDSGDNSTGLNCCVLSRTEGFAMRLLKLYLRDLSTAFGGVLNTCTIRWHADFYFESQKVLLDCF